MVGIKHMGKRLEGKNIVVTAAGQGIGRATAIIFYEKKKFKKQGMV